MDHLKQDFSLNSYKDKIKQNTVFVSKTHKRIHKEAKKIGILKIKMTTVKPSITVVAASRNRINLLLLTNLVLRIGNGISLIKGATIRFWYQTNTALKKTYLRDHLECLKVKE